MFCKEDCSPENIRLFKHLLDFRLFRDGHVVVLSIVPWKEVVFVSFNLKFESSGE